MQQTLKCNICDRPYVFYPYSAADQSACPACVAEAQRAVRRPDTDEERRRRDRYFNG